MRIICVAVLFSLGSISFTQNVSIPDPIFKSFLVANYDTSMDGEISLTEAMAVSGSMVCSGLGIADLTGIEAFTGIQSLNGADN